ncbi:hypothetical protein WJX79_010786 [Trebouxia sp. C0005]
MSRDFKNVDPYLSAQVWISGLQISRAPQISVHWACCQSIVTREAMQYSIIQAHESLSKQITRGLSYPGCSSPLKSHDVGSTRCSFTAPQHAAA